MIATVAFDICNVYKMQQTEEIRVSTSQENSIIIPSGTKSIEQINLKENGLLKCKI